MNLEPGPGLDAAVAKALGWSVEFRCVNPPCPTGAGLRPGGQKIETIPPFSTDWNAAMQAAEALGLFRGNYLTEFDGWQVGNNFKGTISSGATGPLAICRAVLALKGAEHGS